MRIILKVGEVSVTINKDVSWDLMDEEKVVSKAAHGGTCCTSSPRREQYQERTRMVRFSGR